MNIIFDITFLPNNDIILLIIISHNSDALVSLVLRTRQIVLRLFISPLSIKFLISENIFWSFFGPLESPNPGVSIILIGYLYIFVGSIF